MQDLGLAAQTMFAELIQQTMDAEFDKDGYDERGNFIRKKIDGPLYWYYQRKINGKLKQTYVGPVKDEYINSRVKRFNEIKSDFARRRTLVRALLAIGIPSPDTMTGLVIEALWKAGFFRLRGVLVGTTAFQCYSGILGVKLTSASLATQDLDAAQFYDISNMVGDSMPPILDVLKQVDDSFSPIPDTAGSPKVARYRSTSTGYLVEFLTPNRGSNANSGRLSNMPALGGAAAIPLRYLDYLIYDPIRSVTLFKGGIPVLVPQPARYAIHKLIISAVRENKAKVPKDIMQAEQLFQAMLQQQSFELYEAWIDAWERGPSWRSALKKGLAALSVKTRDAFIFAIQGHGWAEAPAASRRVAKISARRRKTPKKKVLSKPKP